MVWYFRRENEILRNLLESIYFSQRYLLFLHENKILFGVWNESLVEATSKTNEKCIEMPKLN